MFTEIRKQFHFFAVPLDMTEVTEIIDHDCLMSCIVIENKNADVAEALLNTLSFITFW